MKLGRRSFLGASVAAAALGTAACTRAPDRAPGDPIVLQGAYENNPGEPIHDSMLEWARLLDERSDGEVRMSLFPSSQLGSKTDVIDQMLAGSPVITLADGAFYADQGVPDFGITFAPFLFETWDDCWTLTESEWYRRQLTGLEQKGLKILCSNWIYGERHTLLTRPVSSVEELHGMKIRVPANIIQIEGFSALGATPTPMALGDVYTSLQQGTIDGLENPLPVLENGKFQEVAKYLALDGHVLNYTTWVTGTATFDSLSEDQQQLLISTGEEVGISNNENQLAAEEEALQTLLDGGVEVLDIDRSEWQEAALSFYDSERVTSLWTDGLHETVKEAIG
ncbi:C4-dicarboxylate TRAP transporter substrate-binding protein [Brachybacterium paraconglomeratum]|uniref:C4-dicarboxylate TRAP transporter substrate-binding protein n=1 Tax=Brachybacterium paraconglomeratum TaxID=173362 RepID=UPI003FD417E6